MEDLAKNLDDQVNALADQALSLINSKDFAKAEALLDELLKAYSEKAVLYYNYAILRVAEKRLDKALELVRQAIKREANDKYVTLLSAIFSQQKKFEQARQVVRDAFKTNPDSYDLLESVLTYDMEEGETEKVIAQAKSSIASGKYEGSKLARIYAFLAISHYIKNEIPECREALTHIQPLIDSTMIKWMAPNAIPYALRIFVIYLQELMKWRDENPEYYTGAEKKIYLIGESHCLSPAYTNLTIDGENYEIIPRLVLGAKAWHFSKASDLQVRKNCLRKILSELPANSKIIFTFGEVDCRPRGGFFTEHLKNPETSLEENIENTVGDYAAYLTKAAKKAGHEASFVGVPAPQIQYVEHGTKEEEREEYLRIHPLFNEALQNSVEDYIDLYEITNRGDGYAKDGVHIDYVHLKPDLFSKAYHARN